MRRQLAAALRRWYGLPAGILVVLVATVTAAALAGPPGARHLKAKHVARSTARLTWKGQLSDGRWTVRVNGRRVARVKGNHLRLHRLACDTSYRVTVSAPDVHSAKLTVRTRPCNVNSIPGGGQTAPGPADSPTPGPGASPTPSPGASPTPGPGASPTPGASPGPTPIAGTPGSAFNPAPLFSGLNHSSLGSATGATQKCDLATHTGYQAGTDHAITFQSGGVRYSGCYSINSSAGASPAAGALRPAVFVFGPGAPRPADTAGEVASAGQEANGIIVQGKKAGWDMIYIGLFQFGSGSGPYAFTFDQVYADYARAVIADLIATNRTDPSRIYAFGTSAGGREPMFMGCHLSDEVAAFVSQAGAVHGPGISSDLPADRCSQPPNPVSAMFVYANAAQPEAGTPNENYAVHVTPSHTTLTASDTAAIAAGPPGQVVYSMQHVGEAWALWDGCAGNLVGHQAQSVTVGIAPDTSPNTQLWQWTGCRDPRGGSTGEVDLYILPGSHGIEPEVQDDGRAFAFLKAHSR